MNAFLKNVGKLLSGAVLGQAVVVLATPILTRLYDPHAFAFQQTFASVMVVLIIVSCLRYDQALTMADNDDVPPLISISLFLLLLSSAICAALAYFFGERLFGSLHVAREYLTVFAAVGTIVYMLPNACSFIFIRDSRFSIVSLGRVLQAVSFVTLAVALYYALHAPWALALGDVVSRIGVCAVLGIVVVRTVPNLRLWFPWTTYLRILKTYKVFPLIALPGGLLNTIGGYSNTIWMLALFNPVAAGAYALVERILAGPTALIVSAMAQVYQAELSPSSLAVRQALAPGFRRLLLMQLKVGAGPALALVLFAPYVFPFVFGSQWAEAATYCQIMAPLQLVIFTAGPFNMVLTLVKRQALQFTWEGIRFALVTGTWATVAFLHAQPFAALIAVSAASALAYLVHMSLAYSAILRWDRELLQSGTASDGG